MRIVLSILALFLPIFVAGIDTETIDQNGMDNGRLLSSGTYEKIGDVILSGGGGLPQGTVLAELLGHYSNGQLCLQVVGSTSPEVTEISNIAVPTQPNNIQPDISWSGTTTLTGCVTSPPITSINLSAVFRINGVGGQRNGQLQNTLFPPCASSICGDPHLQSWGGVKWDYHGECDLVAIRNPNFADGKGLELHVRTTRDHHYSFTNEAAIKIGDDVFEVHSMSEYKLNGEVGDYTNKTTDTLGGFPLSHWHSGSRDNLFFHRHVLDLGETGEMIEIKTFENIVYVELTGSRNGAFKGSIGLFGDADSGKLIGRDGETEYEPSDEYALEWQVRDIDPKLFSIDRAPVYPEKCFPPKKFVPRLGFMQAQKQAQELCAAWDGDKESCVFDVLASGNKDLAQYKVMDAEAKAAALDEQQDATIMEA